MIVSLMSLISTAQEVHLSWSVASGTPFSSGLMYKTLFAGLDGLVCFSPRERLELSKVGPAGFLRLGRTCNRAVPPCWGLWRCCPFGVPEVCRPAWTWKQKIKTLVNNYSWILRDCWWVQVISEFTLVQLVSYPFLYLCLMCSAASHRHHRIQSCGLAPCRRSPSCLGSCPLRFGMLRTWKRETMERRRLAERSQKYLVY